MLVLGVAGSNQTKTLDPKQAVLKSALDALQKLGYSPRDALFLVLQWLAKQLKGGDVHAGAVMTALLNKLQAGAGLEPAVIAALAATGPGQRLLDRIEDLQNEVPFLFRLDESGLPRLCTLQELVDGKPAELNFSESRSSDLSSAPLSFTVGVTAGVKLGMRVVSTATAKSTWNATLGQPQDLGFVLYAGGNLGANVQLAQSGTSLGAAANASQQLTLVYQFDGAKTTLEAIGHVLEDLPSGISLKQLGDTLDLPAQDGLRQFNLANAAGFQFNLSGSTQGTRIDLRSVTVDGKAQQIKTTWGGSVGLSVKFSDQRARLLCISKNADGTLLLHAERNNTQTLNSAIDIAAGVEISGWDAIAAGLVSATLPDATDLIERVGKWANPGAWLKSKLTDALPADLAALAPILIGEVQGEDNVETALKNLIQGLIDSKVNLWAAALDDKADLLIDDLVNGIVSDVSQRDAAKPLRDWLEAKLPPLLSQARDELVNDLKEQVSTATGAFSQAKAKALKDDLAAVGNAISAATNSVAAFVQPVLTFLNNYSAWRAKLIAAVEKTLKLKLSITIAYTYQRTATDQLDFDLLLPGNLIVAPTDLAERDFSRWLRGRAFADDAHPFGLPLNQIQSSWRAVSARMTQIGESLTVDLGSWSATTSTLLKASTRVEIGPSGVLLAQTDASAAKNYGWGDEKFSALGRATFDALMSPLMLSQFSLDIELADNQLTQRELQQILASLHISGAPALLNTVDEAAIVAKWQTLRDKAGADPAARLRLGMALDPAARRRVIDSASDGKALRAAIAQAMVVACNAKPGRNLQTAFSDLGFAGRAEDVLVAQWDDFRKKLSFGPIDFIEINDRPISPSNKTAPVYQAAAAVKRAISPANALYEALLDSRNWPAIDQTVRSETLKLQANPDFNKRSVPDQALALSKLAADYYDRLGTDFAANLGRALSANDVMFDRSDDVPTDTLFVVLLVQSLTGARLVGDLLELTA